MSNKQSTLDGYKRSYNLALGSRARRNSDEFYLDVLRRLADDLGQTPTAMNVKELTDHSTTTYRRRFGTWNAALERAGLEPTKHHGVSDDRLLDDLRSFAVRLGRAPTTTEMNADGPWSAGTYQNHFGTWNGALEEVGIEPNRRYDVSDEWLLDELRRLARRLGRTPTSIEMDERGRMTSVTYADHFGSWMSAVERAGLDLIRAPPGEGKQRNYGPGWTFAREYVLDRDTRACRVCGLDEDAVVQMTGRGLHVHHVTAFESFGPFDTTQAYARAHHPNNLITLCGSHHRRWENVALAPSNW